MSMLRNFRAVLLLACCAALCACIPNNDLGVIDMNKPVMEMSKDRTGGNDRIDEAQAELDDIMRKVRKGDLPKIQFEFDSDEITLASYTTLDAVAQILATHPRLKLLVLAHTCNIGSEPYNLELSTRRARSVNTYLVKRGIPTPPIRYIGKGFSDPIADNNTEEGRILNRRVEFRITYRDWSSVY